MSKDDEETLLLFSVFFFLLLLQKIPSTFSLLSLFLPGFFPFLLSSFFFAHEFLASSFFLSFFSWFSILPPLCVFFSLFSGSSFLIFLSSLSLLFFFSPHSFFLFLPGNLLGPPNHKTRISPLFSLSLSLFSSNPACLILIFFFFSSFFSFYIFFYFKRFFSIKIKKQ